MWPECKIFREGTNGAYVWVIKKSLSTKAYFDGGAIKPILFQLLPQLINAACKSQRRNGPRMTAPEDARPLSKILGGPHTFLWKSQRWRPLWAAHPLCSAPPFALHLPSPSLTNLLSFLPPFPCALLSILNQAESCLVPPLIPFLLPPPNLPPQFTSPLACFRAVHQRKKPAGSSNPPVSTTQEPIAKRNRW